MVKKAMSQTFFVASAVTLPAASYGTMSSGTCSRQASSRAMSTDTPRASPVLGSFCASTVLPKLIAARSVPLGASSLVTYDGAKPTARHEPSSTASATTRILLIKLCPAFLDELRPFREILCHELAELGGRAAHRLRPVRGDTALDVGLRERAQQFFVQPLHQRR